MALTIDTMDECGFSNKLKWIVNVCQRTQADVVLTVNFIRRTMFEDKQQGRMFI